METKAHIELFAKALKAFEDRQIFIQDDAVKEGVKLGVFIVDPNVKGKDSKLPKNGEFLQFSNMSVIFGAGHVFKSLPYFIETVDDIEPVRVRTDKDGNPAELSTLEYKADTEIRAAFIEKDAFPKRKERHLPTLFTLSPADKFNDGLGIGEVIDIADFIAIRDMR